mmetsp:Transcript_4024/g.11632  ORF Transcript_4024/g.11632 Transcript_4024/m.11632 type:complete len:288 (+) Transcript_4024:215-1078(+)
MADAGARGKRPRTNVHDWYDSCVTSTSYVRCPVCVEEREAGTRHADDVHSGRKDNLIASNGHISRKHGPNQLDQYKSWKDIAGDPAVRNITSFFLPSATGRHQRRVLLRRALLRNPARAPLLHPRRSLAYSTRALRLCSWQRSTAVEGSLTGGLLACSLHTLERPASAPRRFFPRRLPEHSLQRQWTTGLELHEQNAARGQAQVQAREQGGGPWTACDPSGVSCPSWRMRRPGLCPGMRRASKLVMPLGFLVTVEKMTAPRVRSRARGWSRKYASTASTGEPAAMNG